MNRIWQYHFGRGLVATASDFGRLGERPSHPELLDWLTTEFVARGWSLKQMHRLILTSATYRQSASHPDATNARRKDPENRLHWHRPTRRLDVEPIRDAMLAVSGELDLTVGGPAVDANEPRRTVYAQVKPQQTRCAEAKPSTRPTDRSRPPARRDRHPDPGPPDDQRLLDPGPGQSLRRSAPQGSGRRRGRGSNGPIAWPSDASPAPMNGRKPSRSSIPNKVPSPNLKWPRRRRGRMQAGRVRIRRGGCQPLGRLRHALLNASEFLYID